MKIIEQKVLSLQIIMNINKLLKYMKFKKTNYTLLILIIVFYCIIYTYNNFSPAQRRMPYKTRQHSYDTLRIAFIGDSWALGHKYHNCKIDNILGNLLNRPIKVSSYGIGGFTSKEIYNALYDNNDLKQFLEKEYHFCYISAGINDTHKKMSLTYYKQSMDCIIQFMLDNQIHPIIQEIPDYNIIKAFDDQKTSKKLIRRFSMLINGTSIDCKQDYRDALDELINKKGYKDRVSVIRYKSWNNDYENDLKRLYINDGIHLNEDGYAILDSIIAKTIFHHYTSKHYLSHDRLR